MPCKTVHIFSGYLVCFKPYTVDVKVILNDCGEILKEALIVYFRTFPCLEVMKNNIQIFSLDSNPLVNQMRFYCIKLTLNVKI